jgi:hypothetical protein
VVGSISIDRIQNSFRHRDIDPARLDAQRRLIDRHDGPRATFEIAVSLVLVQLAADGIACPSSINPSMCNSIASLAMAKASSKVAPAEKHPGKSGTVIP